MRVLVVDDDSSLREGVAALIQESGFDVETADSGDAADSWVRAVPFSGVVLDLGLPDGDGLALLRQWRRRGLARPRAMLAEADEEVTVGVLPFSP